MERPPTDPEDRPTHARVRAGWRRTGVIAVLACITLLLGCSGGSTPDESANESAPPPDVVEAPISFDPATPITSPVGKEFDVMLPADPGSGWRWVLSPIDNTRLIALGSRFSDDPTLLARAETVTTTTSSTVAPARTPTTTVEASTTTTAAPVLPMVQIISFAGRAAGQTTITFRYTQIAGTPQEENEIAVFTVQIVP